MSIDEYSPRITVRRLGDRDTCYQRERILIVVEVAHLDDTHREDFFEEMAQHPDAGIAIDPLSHPGIIFICSEESDEGCGYRGRFIRLNRYSGAFSILAPTGLVDLLFDEGSTEVEYRCDYDEDTFFYPDIKLPEGRSLLSLFNFEQARKPASGDLQVTSCLAFAPGGLSESEVAAAIA